MFVTTNKRFKITKRLLTTLSLVFSPLQYFSKEHQKASCEAMFYKNNSFKDGGTISIANNCYQKKKRKNR